MKGIALVFCLLAGPLWAQTLPAQYEVTGVADNDVLNIRAEPRASAELVGTYWPYALNIEVLRLSDDGGWGMVGLPEGNGWVSMRYLRPQPVTPGDFPLPLTCYGTEPFWTIGLYPGGSEYNDPFIGRMDLELLEGEAGANGVLARLRGDDRKIDLITERGWCSDGMSDREFGWRATAFLRFVDDTYTVSGCCTLDGN